MSKYIVRDKQFYKTVAILATPVILQNMITIMVNTIMLGKFGEIQLSGSSLANSFVGVFQILCMGIGGGAAVLTAQYWGANNRDAVRKISVLMVRISMVFALVFFSMSLLMPETIMRWFASDPEVIEAGVVYLRIVAPTFIFTSLTIPTMIDQLRGFLLFQPVFQLGADLWQVRSAGNADSWCSLGDCDCSIN